MIEPKELLQILKNLFQLFNTLVDRNVLTWEFFANRFESIINEIQETKYIKSDEFGAETAPTAPPTNPIQGGLLTNYKIIFQSFS